MRSALSIYSSDNEGAFPLDDLTSITNSSRYLLAVPLAVTQPDHQDSMLVTGEATVTDTGGWSYNNSNASLQWGALHVGCLHQDSRGETWSTY